MKRAILMTTAALMLSVTAAAQVDSRLPEPELMQFHNPAPGETSFDFKLKGYVFGIRMIKSSYRGRIGDGDYTAFADIYTSGLGALLKKLRIWAVTEGRFDDTALYPLTHTQQNMDKKSRRVEMAYNYDERLVGVDINPPIGSQGVPPATPKERFEAKDTVSAILTLMMKGQRLEGDVCDGTVRVFDSKQHYGLRMEKAGTKRVKYEGEKVESIRCHVFYEPISGFDPEDLPDAEEGGTPVKVYFVKDDKANLYVPARFTYKISGFKAVIKLSDMRVEQGSAISGTE